MKKTKVLKKSLCVLFALAICVTSILGFTITASAASYPTAIPEKYTFTGNVGDVIAINFSVFHEYQNEKMHVAIYDPSGNLVANSDRTFSQYTTYMTKYTVAWNTSGLSAGKYKVVTTMEFYSLYSWHSNPKEELPCYVELTVKPTLGMVGNTWYCYRGNSIDWGYTGIVEYGGGYYYVENGVLNWGSAPTLAEYNGDWYFVQNGGINWGYTGLVSYGGNWYYVQNGWLDWASAPTLTYYGGNWYYVANGALDWGYTGLVNYNGCWYYVQNGSVNWSGVPTLTNYNGDWYYVINGAVDWGYTGLVNYNDCWYYVENGWLNWASAPTLTNYGGSWYYVAKGVLDWNYTGYCYYNGWNYYITKGFLDWSRQ